MIVYQYTENGKTMAKLLGIEQFNRISWSPAAEILDVLPLNISTKGMQFLTIRKNAKISSYEKKQIVLRERAWRWQQILSESAISWGELGEVSAWFERMAKRYGLLTEFRENGIC